MFLLLHISLLILNIFWINCDQTCDCNQIEPLKEIVQQLMLEQKLESAKLRKMEARQRSATHGSVWTTERLSEMEASVKDVDNKVNFLLQENKHDKKEDISTVLKKTLTSEKLERINFGSELESQMTKMKGNFKNFKTETTSKVDGYIANISNIKYDFKRDVNEMLEDIKGQTDRTVSKVMKDVTSLQNLYKLEIDAKLEKTKADVINNNRQIAFTGKLSKHMQFQKMIIRFDDITTNIGNAYNTATGKFICPFSGLYLVSCNILGATEGYIVVRIYLNGKVIARPYTGSGDGHNPATNTAVVHANAGDAIYAKIAYGSSKNLDLFSRFSVVLLKAD